MRSACLLLLAIVTAVANWRKDVPSMTVYDPTCTVHADPAATRWHVYSNHLSAWFALICRKIKSVEFMVCDSVALVAGPLGLCEAICSDADLQAYLNLDDSLLQSIKMLVPERHENPSDILKVSVCKFHWCMSWLGCHCKMRCKPEVSLAAHCA